MPRHGEPAQRAATSRPHAAAGPAAGREGPQGVRPGGVHVQHRQGAAPLHRHAAAPGPQAQDDVHDGAEGAGAVGEREPDEAAALPAAGRLPAVPPHLHVPREGAARPDAARARSARLRGGPRRHHAVADRGAQHDHRQADAARLAERGRGAARAGHAAGDARAGHVHRRPHRPPQRAAPPQADAAPQERDLLHTLPGEGGGLHGAGRRAGALPVME